MGGNESADGGCDCVPDPRHIHQCLDPSAPPSLTIEFTEVRDAITWADLGATGDRSLPPALAGWYRDPRTGVLSKFTR